MAAARRSTSATRTSPRFTPRRALRGALAGAALALTVFATPAAAGSDPHWQARAPLPVAQQEVASAALGGRLYVAGGFGSVGLELISDRHWRFDPATGAWSELARLPDPVHHLHAVALRGRMHYLGGESGLDFTPTGQHLIYDPEVDRFAFGSPLPAGRRRGAAAVAKHRGKIYLAGGVGAGGASGMLDVYDPRTGRWRRLPEMPTPREHLGAAFVGDRLYAVGGRDGEGTVRATEAYDVSERRWIRGLPPIPTARGGLAVTSLGGFVYAIGGEGAGRAHDEVERLNPRRRRWSAQPAMPTPRHGFEAARLRGKLWLAGGATAEGFGPTGTHEVFVPRR